MIYTDVGCCCSLFDVVSSVVFSFCQQVSKQIVCFFFFFFFFLVFFFFFFLPLSLYPPFSFFLSLSSPSLLTFPTTFFFFFFFFFYYYFFLYIYIYIFFSFLLSLSCFLCPLVLSVTVWLSKRVYKIKIN